MKTDKLIFHGFPDYDVYNVTAPFRWRGYRVIAGRVEKRSEELSQIFFFMESRDGWVKIDEAPTFPGLQDPCITKIDERLVLGGVRYPVTFEKDKKAWQMEFYQEKTDGSFEMAFLGPPKMKDIRLLQMPDDRIFVLTRPQGKRGGRGKIGFCIIDSLAEISWKTILEAPLLDHCPEEQWVGANQAHFLSNGLIGVLGHLGSFLENGDRRYRSMVFAIDPATGNSTQTEVIAKRSDFPPGISKRPDLQDVIFSGGLIRLEKGRARLFAGLSDAEAGWLDLPDPFLKFET